MARAADHLQMFDRLEDGCVENEGIIRAHEYVCNQASENEMLLAVFGETYSIFKKLKSASCSLTVPRTQFGKSICAHRPSMDSPAREDHRL